MEKIGLVKWIFAIEAGDLLDLVKTTGKKIRRQKMQEVKTLGETGTLITPDSKYKELIERVGTVENNINQSEAAEYIKHSSVSKKDIKDL